MMPSCRKLILCGVPERIMRGGRFQFFEGVEVGAFVFCVLPKRVASPKRQGFVFGVVFDHRTMDETDVSPGDDLVEEGFHGLIQTPPATATSVVWGVNKAHVPAVMREDVVENGMDTDVAEMKPWR